MYYFELSAPVRREIQAARQPYNNCPIEAFNPILTDVLLLPGHSDRGHHTEVIALATSGIESTQPRGDVKSVIELVAVVCIDCMQSDIHEHVENTTPFIVAALIKNLSRKQ